MGTEPLAFRDARGRTEVPSDQKLPVPRRECSGALVRFGTGQWFIQESQSSQCIADCAGHVDEISDSRTAPKQGFAGRDHPDQRHAEKPSAARNRRISADESYAVRAAGGHHTSVQLKNLVAGAGAGNGQGDEQMLRSASHRRDVAEIRCRGAEADIRHRSGSEVEVDPFR